MGQEAVIYHPVVEKVRELIQEQNAWVDKCVREKEALDTDGQIEFKEIFRVMTDTPFSDEDMKLILRIGDDELLKEAHDLMMLRSKWAPYLHSEDFASEAE